MYRIALKMLVEDKAKFIGMILALSFSAIIITQQMAIFLGLMRRSYSLIQDTPQAHIWVMNPSVKMIDDVNPIRTIDLYRIRSIDGIKWAVPFYKGAISSRLPNGQFQTCNLFGIDSATFIGAPHTMLEGKVEDLRKPFSIIVDKVGAEDKLAQYQGPGKPKKPLRVGDEIELNDHRARVVGICEVTRTFRSDPVIYTTFDRALFYAPFERKRLAYVLAAPNEGVDVQVLCKKIEKITSLRAYTNTEFEEVTIDYYLRNTGIPINFGIAVLLGLLVGAAITGQIFFNFTSDNLKYLALFTVVGASRNLLAKITLLQATWLAFLGWGIGSGLAALIGFLTTKTELAFFLPWQLFVGTGFLMYIICIASSLISIRRIFNIQLWTMFKQ
jgi:putative ABC transport system permease protein